MPSVSAPSKILVTGGTGFIGAWVIRRLLENGFSVRAAVRSQSKADFLQGLFKDYTDKLEFTIVEDIVAPGAFDGSVVGVDAIIHCAAPLTPSDPLSDPADNIDPAVQGTVGILQSAHKTTGIQRVVLESSISAVWEPKKEAFVYTEDNWNESATKIVEKHGRQAPPFLKYAAAKTLAEEAAWKWVKDNQPAFDIVTLMPAFVLGEIISETTSEIKGSNRRLFGPLKKAALESRKPEDYLEEFPIVDVRDTAEHHLLALTKSEAGGERFIINAGSVSVQQILDILNANPVEGITIPVGYPEKQKDWKPLAKFSNEKIKKLLGASFLPIEETVRNTLIHGLKIGWTQ